MAVAHGTERSVRADAARNIARILTAARAAYAEHGPDIAVEEIARRAEVGERTLYRHFPSKGQLIRAALDQSVAEHLSPAIERALASRDALQAIAILIEASTELGAREHHLLVAARKADALTNISAPLEQALADLLIRAKADGQVRADLAAEDLPRLITMLNSVLWTMAPGSDGWRRYVTLLIDAIAIAPPRALPAVAPIEYAPPGDGWPM